MKDEAIAGLDIGSTKTCAVVAVSRDGVWHVIGVGEAPCNGMRRGVVTNLQEVVKSIELATEQAERMAGTTISQVYVGIGGDHVRAHSSKASVAISSENSEIDERDVARVLEASRQMGSEEEPAYDRHVLHALPRAFSLDGINGVVDPVGLEAKRLEVEAHVVSGAASTIANLLKCVSRAGLEAIGIVYEPLAASAATLNRDEMLAGALLLDIGAGATHIALISGGRVVYTAVVPVGGALITSDLAMGLRMPYAEAELVKCEFDWYADEDRKVMVGTNGSRHELELQHATVRRIVQPRLDELLRLVRVELSKAIALDVRIEEIVVTGGGANLSGIERAIQEIFGLPVRIGIPSMIEGLADDIKQPQYAAAIGLLVYGPGGPSPHRLRPPRRTLAQRILAWFGELWN